MGPRETVSRQRTREGAYETGREPRRGNKPKEGTENPEVATHLRIRLDSSVEQHPEVGRSRARAHERTVRERREQRRTARSPRRPEGPSKTECSAPRCRNREEPAPENGGRTHRAIGDVEPPATRPPVREEREQESLIPQATTGVIPTGVAPREGNGNGGRIQRRTRKGTSTGDSTRTGVCGLVSSGNRRSESPAETPEGKSPGRSAERSRNAANDGDGRNAPPTDFGPCGTKPNREARASRRGDERQEGSRTQ